MTGDGLADIVIALGVPGYPTPLSEITCVALREGGHSVRPKS